MCAHVMGFGPTSLSLKKCSLKVICTVHAVYIYPDINILHLINIEFRHKEYYSMTTWLSFSLS